MAVRLSITGMEQSTANRLRTALEQAGHAIGAFWELEADEAAATHVIVDMDSVYGPMSWIRLHGAGKRVVGLTSSPRTNADFYLHRDFDPPAIQALLRQVAAEAGEAIPVASDAPSPLHDAALPTGEASAIADAPAPAERLQDGLPHDVAPPTAPPPPDRRASFPAAQDPTLADWFRPGVLGGRFSYKYGDNATLLIDTDRGVYHGPDKLKPLTAAMQAVVQASDLKPLDTEAWQAATAKASPAQPLDRLKWFGALLAGNGELAAGTDQQGQYRLTRWARTEREFPKHFRIATAMMRGPATIAEIAEAAQVPHADVADFINANLAVGYAELVPAGPARGPEPARPAGGLFGRLRGR